MTSFWRPDLLSKEARDEAYEYFDKNVRPLPKKADGKINTTAFGLSDNDIDAFRHAHVSGVLTIVYSETTADILGLTFPLKIVPVNFLVSQHYQCQRTNAYSSTHL